MNESSRDFIVTSPSKCHLTAVLLFFCIFYQNILSKMKLDCYDYFDFVASSSITWKQCFATVRS